MSIKVHRGILYRDYSGGVTDISGGLIAFSPQTDTLKSLYVSLNISTESSGILRFCIISLNENKFPLYHDSYLSSDSDGSFTPLEYLNYFYLESNDAYIYKNSISVDGSTDSKWYGVIEKDHEIYLPNPDGSVVYGLLIYIVDNNDNPTTIKNFTINYSNTEVTKNTDTNCFLTLSTSQANWNTQKINSTNLKPMICHNCEEIVAGSNYLDFDYIKAGGNAGINRGTNLSVFIYSSQKTNFNSLIFYSSDEVVKTLIDFFDFEYLYYNKNNLNIDFSPSVSSSLPYQDLNSFDSVELFESGDFIFLYQKDWKLINPRNYKSEIEIKGLNVDEFLTFGYNSFAKVAGYGYAYGYGYGFGSGSDYFDIDYRYSNLFGFDYHLRDGLNSGYFLDSGLEASAAYAYGFGYQAFTYVEPDYPSKFFDEGFIHVDSSYLEDDKISNLIVGYYPIERQSTLTEELIVSQYSGGTTGYLDYSYFDIFPYDNNSFKTTIKSSFSSYGIMSSDYIDQDLNSNLTRHGIRISNLDLTSSPQRFEINYDFNNKRPKDFIEKSVSSVEKRTFYCASDLNASTSVSDLRQIKNNNINNCLVFSNAPSNRWKEGDYDYCFISKKFDNKPVDAGIELTSFNLPPHLVLHDYKLSSETDSYNFILDGLSFVSGYYSLKRKELGIFDGEINLKSNLIVNSNEIHDNFINVMNDRPKFGYKLGNSNSFCFKGFSLTLYQNKNDLATNEFFEKFDPSAAEDVSSYQSDTYGFRTRKYLIRNIQNNLVVLEGLIIFQGSYLRTGDTTIQIAGSIPDFSVIDNNSNVYLVLNPFDLSYSNNSYSCAQTKDPHKLIALKDVSIYSTSGGINTISLNVSTDEIATIFGGWASGMSTHYLPFYIIQTSPIASVSDNSLEQFNIATELGNPFLGVFPDFFKEATSTSFGYIPSGYGFPLAFPSAYGYPRDYYYTENIADLPDTKNNQNGEDASIGFSITLPYFVGVDELDNANAIKWCKEAIFKDIELTKIDGSESNRNVYVWDNPVKLLKPHSDLVVYDAKYKWENNKFYYDFVDTPFDIYENTYLENTGPDQEQEKYITLIHGSSIYLDFDEIHKHPFDSVCFFVSGEVSGELQLIVGEKEEETINTINLNSFSASEINTKLTEIKYVYQRLSRNYYDSGERKIKLTYINESNPKAEIKINNFCLHREIVLLGTCQYPYRIFSLKDYLGAICEDEETLIVNFNTPFLLSYFEFNVRDLSLLDSSINNVNNVYFNIYIDPGDGTSLQTYTEVPVVNSVLRFRLNCYVKNLIIIPVIETSGMTLLLNKFKVRVKSSLIPIYESSSPYLYRNIFYNYNATTLELTTPTRMIPVGYGTTSFNLFDISTYNAAQTWVSRVILNVEFLSNSSDYAEFDVVYSNDNYAIVPPTASLTTISDSYKKITKQKHHYLKTGIYTIDSSSDKSFILNSEVMYTESVAGSQSSPLNVNSIDNNWVAVVNSDGVDNMESEHIYLVVDTATTISNSGTNVTSVTFKNDINSNFLVGKSVYFERSAIFNFIPKQIKNIGVRLNTNTAYLKVIGINAFTPVMTYVSSTNQPYDITPLGDMEWSLKINYSEE